MHAILVFTYAESDPRKTTSGFPARLFLLPARTNVLVAWPMLCGVAVTPGVYLAWALLVFRPVGVDLPLGWPALLLAAGVACFQGIAWTLGGYPAARVLAAVLVVVVLVAAGVLASGAIPLDPPIAPWLAVMLPLVVVAAYVVAVAGVAACRRGDWPRDLGPRLRVGRTRAAGDIGSSSRGAARAFRASFASSAPFTSPERAQLWLEWRQHGALMPGYAALVLAILVLAAVTGIAPQEFWPFLGFLAALPAFIASLVGPGLAKSSLWARDLELSSFAATRPLPDAAIAGARLRVLGLGIVLVWVMVLAVAPCFVYLSGHGHMLTELWETLGRGVEPATLWASASLLGAGWLCLPWMVGGAGLSVALTGRTSAPWTVFVTSVILVVVGACGLLWLARHPATLPTALRLLPWAEWGVALLVASGSATFFRVALRRGLLGWRSARASVAVAVGLLLLAAFLAWVAGPRLGHHLVAASVGAVALGLSPLATAPLALAWNRHR
jgi:hypothetical protein